MMMTMIEMMIEMMIIHPYIHSSTHSYCMCSVKAVRENIVCLKTLLPRIMELLKDEGTCWWWRWWSYCCWWRWSYCGWWRWSYCCCCCCWWWWCFFDQAFSCLHLIVIKFNASSDIILSYNYHPYYCKLQLQSSWKSKEMLMFLMMINTTYWNYLIELFIK